MIKPRQKKFLDNLNTNGFNVSKAAKDAGYSDQYADKRGKHLLNSALKGHAKEIVSTLENKPTTRPEAKQLMHELVGMSRTDVFNRLKSIAEQDKDLSSALKVLSSLAKEIGITLDTSETNVQVPVLNIIVDKPSEPVLLEGSTEPQ
jgi:phage terminase small subunit